MDRHQMIFFGLNNGDPILHFPLPIKFIFSLALLRRPLSNVKNLSNLLVLGHESFMESLKLAHKFSNLGLGG